jgi:hypothetical protein
MAAQEEPSAYHPVGAPHRQVQADDRLDHTFRPVGRGYMVSNMVLLCLQDRRGSHPERSCIVPVAHWLA